MSKHVELDNARDDEQKRRMEDHKKSGNCHFCPEGFVSHSSPVIITGNYWFVAGNDFPYEGSEHHYLIVSKEHVTEIEQIRLNALFELHSQIIPKLKQKLGVDGYSLFVRVGNMKRTAATIDHLHYHFVAGAEKKDKNHPIIVGPLGYQKDY